MNWSSIRDGRASFLIHSAEGKGEYQEVSIADGREGKTSGEMWNRYIITKDIQDEGKYRRMYLTKIEKTKGSGGAMCFSWGWDKKKALPFGKRSEAIEYARRARGEVRQRREPITAGEKERKEK